MVSQNKPHKCVYIYKYYEIKGLTLKMHKRLFEECAKKNS